MLTNKLVQTSQQPNKQANKQKIDKQTNKQTNKQTKNMQKRQMVEITGTIMLLDVWRLLQSFRTIDDHSS